MVSIALDVIGWTLVVAALCLAGWQAWNLAWVLVKGRRYGFCLWPRRWGGPP